MAIVLGLVADEVDPEPGSLEARQAAVVIDGPVADRAGRQLGGGPRRLAVRQSAATAEAPRPWSDGVPHWRQTVLITT